MKSFYSIIVFTFLVFQSYGQDFWFGPKFGPSLSFQRWLNFEPNALLAYGADFAVESYSESSLSSLYAQVGYHVRGSSLRSFTWQGESIGTQGFKFNNAVLELGAKRRISTNRDIIPFYQLGLRVEYTINTNLKDYERFNSAFYPTDQFVERFLYGASIGGGFEWTNFSEYFRPYFEVCINPDFGDQYYQEAIPNVIDQFGNVITLRERVIRNLSVELKFGFKFLRKVVYID